MSAPTPTFTQSEEVTWVRMTADISSRIAKNAGTGESVYRATERALAELPEYVTACNRHAALLSQVARLREGLDLLLRQADACDEFRKTFSPFSRESARALLAETEGAVKTSP